MLSIPQTQCVLLTPNNPNEYEDVVWQILAQIEAQALTVFLISLEARRRIVEEALRSDVLLRVHEYEERLAAVVNITEFGVRGSSARRIMSRAVTHASSRPGEPEVAT